MKETKIFKELTIKYFNFLVRDYGYKYSEKEIYFENNKTRIYIEQYDHHIPSISVWLKSEPKYTKMLVDNIFTTQIDYAKADKYLQEEYFVYFSELLNANIGLLINYSESTLIKSLKKELVIRLKSMGLTKDNYLINLSLSSRNIYNYIKSKDRKWDLGKELQKKI